MNNSETTNTDITFEANNDHQFSHCRFSSVQTTRLPVPNKPGRPPNRTGSAPAADPKPRDETICHCSRKSHHNDTYLGRTSILRPPPALQPILCDQAIVHFRNMPSNLGRHKDTSFAVRHIYAFVHSNQGVATCYGLQERTTRTLHDRNPLTKTCPTSQVLALHNNIRMECRSHDVLPGNTYTGSAALPSTTHGNECSSYTTTLL